MDTSYEDDIWLKEILNYVDDIPDTAKELIKFYRRYERLKKVQSGQTDIEFPKTLKEYKLSQGVLLVGKQGSSKVELAKSFAATSGVSWDILDLSADHGSPKLFDVQRKNIGEILILTNCDSESLCSPKSNCSNGPVCDMYHDPWANSSVFVIGIASDITRVPSCLLRPGRLSDTIEILSPDKTTRLNYLYQITKNYPISEKTKDDILPQVAQKTHNLFKDDILRLCRNAYINFISRHTPLLEMNFADFLYGIRTVVPVELQQLSLAVPEIDFSKIYGFRKIKELITEIIVNPLRDSHKYNLHELNPPKGVLLYGPSGVGKTVLSYAIANEIGFRTVNIDSTRIRSKIVGQSERNIIKIFSIANSCLPCTLIIDQIESLVPARGSDVTSENTSERIVSTFLTEMDGIATIRNTNRPIFTIAVTEFPEKVDNAILRSGRLDVHIPIRLPDHEMRTELFRGLMSNMPHNISNEHWTRFADLTEKWNSAQIKNICRTAGLIAIKNNKHVVESDFIIEALKESST